MASINILEELQAVATIAVTVSSDEAELLAGQAVPVKAVQIGTMTGKPLFLNATLSLGAPVNS